MFDNVFIVMMHVYPINNGGGPGHETKNGAAKSTVALLILREYWCLFSVLLDLGGPLPVSRRKIRPKTGVLRNDRAHV
jgi:hypothetical protein